jgi:hypothetical protein
VKEAQFIVRLILARIFSLPDWSSGKERERERDRERERERENKKKGFDRDRGLYDLGSNLAMTPGS